MSSGEKYRCPDCQVALSGPSDYIVKFKEVHDCNRKFSVAERLQMVEWKIDVIYGILASYVNER